MCVCVCVCACVCVCVCVCVRARVCVHYKIVSFPNCPKNSLGMRLITVQSEVTNPNWTKGVQIPKDRF